VLVIVFCPTLRYTTMWQSRAIHRASLPPRYLTPPDIGFAGTLWFRSDHVSEFVAPSLGDMARALKKHPHDWRLATGVALLAEEPPHGMLRGARIKPEDLQRKAFEHAIAANPNSAALRGWAATVYIKRSFDLRWHYARGTRAQERYLDRVDVRFARPQYLARAEEHLRTATALQPDNGFYDQLLAYVWLLRGQPERAVESLERALGKRKWTTDSTGMLELADHALAMSGADPLAARVVRGQVVLWPPRQLFWLHSEFARLIWRAKEAGDADRAIRIYRALVGLASKIRQIGVLSREGMWMPDIFKGPVFSPADLGPLEARADPLMAELSPFLRGRAAANMLEHEWYNYLRAHGYANLAVFAMTEREILASYAYMGSRELADPAPDLNRSVRLWTVQGWVTAVLLVAALALVILWTPRSLPAEFRRRVTLAFDEGAIGRTARGVMVALAAAIFSSCSVLALWLSGRMGDRPELLGQVLAAAMLVTAAAALLMVATFVCWLRPPREFFSPMARFGRSATLWLINALLILWLALSVPLYISAKVGVDKLTAMQEREIGVGGTVVTVPAKMPPVPGPDRASVPPR
jgi:tetratricopeptide (TPR) repeat protein